MKKCSNDVPEVFILMMQKFGNNKQQQQEHERRLTSPLPGAHICEIERTTLTGYLMNQTGGDEADQEDGDVTAGQNVSHDAGVSGC